MTELRYLVEFKGADSIPLATFNSWSDVEAFVVHRCKGLGCSERAYPITDQITGAIEFINPVLLGSVVELADHRKPPNAAARNARDNRLATLPGSRQA